MRSQLTMVQQAHAYLKHRRAMGFVLLDTGRRVLRFAQFVDQSGQCGPLTTNLILRWVRLPEAASRSYLKARLSAIRGFARYVAARDGQTEVPDWRLIPEAFRLRPHLYDERQLQQLLVAASQIRPDYQLRPLTYRTLFGLLASTGLRISEALKLASDQVDLKRGLVRVEQTKFKKSRLVPLHPTTIRALRRYVAARNHRWGCHDGSSFFVGHNGLALKYKAVSTVFHLLLHNLGWDRGNGERPRPRIHDLRHSFACRRLLYWYRDGEDVHHRIAALATYLGHGRVTNTYWYLSATPELLAVIGSRFERFASPAGRRRS